MRLVTRNQYSRVMTENIDGMRDMRFSISVPANTPLTVHETYTVPAGYVGVLRSATGNVRATPSVGQAYALLRMARPGQPAVDVLQVFSDAGTAAEEKSVSVAYNIIMPEGTQVQACYANTDGTASRSVRLNIVIDLIRL